MEDSTKDLLVTLIQQVIVSQQQMLTRQEQSENELHELKADIRELKERQSQTEGIILARLSDTRPLGAQAEVLQRLDRIDRKPSLLEKALGEMASRDLELRSPVGLIEAQMEQPKTQ